MIGLSTFEADPDLDRVWAWFEFQEQLLVASQRNVLLQLRNDGKAKAFLHQHELQFLALTPSEVQEFYSRQRSELEMLTMFAILATAEAVIRRDYQERASKRWKDALSRRFRQVNQVRENRVRLDEDILGAMKDEGVAQRAIAEFRGALNLRNWLAHGRYGSPKLGREYDPGDVMRISKALINSIPPARFS